jgi:hypothetical protein
MGSRCSRSAARQRGSSSWVTRIRTPGTTAVANCSSNSWTERSSSGSATSHEKSRTSLIRAVASPSRNGLNRDCPGAVDKSSVQCRRSRSATDRVNREEKLPDGPRRTRTQDRAGSCDRSPGTSATAVRQLRHRASTRSPAASRLRWRQTLPREPRANLARTARPSRPRLRVEPVAPTPGQVPPSLLTMCARRVTLFTDFGGAHTIGGRRRREW